MITHDEIPGVTERYLMDNVGNIKKGCIIRGNFPPYSKYENNFSVPTDINQLDFTNSFLFYMIENRHLLNFPFEIVDAPTYIVYYVDTTTKPNTGGTNAGTISINSQPGVVKTRNTPTMSSMGLLKNIDIQGIERIYNEILSDMNYTMLHRQEAAIYFFKLLTSKTVSPDDRVRFMARFGTSIKGMNNIKPYGKLRKPDKNSPWNKLRI